MWIKRAKGQRKGHAFQSRLDDLFQAARILKIATIYKTDYRNGKGQQIPFLDYLGVMHLNRGIRERCNVQIEAKCVDEVSLPILVKAGTGLTEDQWKIWNEWKAVGYLAVIFWAKVPNGEIRVVYHCHITRAIKEGRKSVPWEWLNETDEEKILDFMRN